MSDVVHKVANADGIYLFHCPGCGYAHHIDTKRWTFNGDLEKPTASPSLLVNAIVHESDPNVPRCHSFVENGNIRFLSDCTHELAGQTVPLPPCSEWY